MYFNYKEKTGLDYSALNLKNIQSYIPTYKLLFKFKDKDYNKFELDTHHTIQKIIKRLDHNNIEVKLDNGSVKPVFIKYSGLLDPIKYIIGQYKFDEKLFTLPNLSTNSHTKLINPYNNAYIDGLFSYLTSHLLHNNKFIHGLDFYGMSLANQEDYKINIYDDFDYVCSSSQFISNIDKYFKLDYKLDILKSTKPKLKILDSIKLDNTEIIKTDDILSSCQPLTIKNVKTFTNLSNKKLSDISSNISSLSDISSNISSLSDISSKKSISSNNSLGNSSLSNNSDNESDEEPIYVHINHFPVNMIYLEKCKDTLDNYMIYSDIEQEEWKSILMQVVMMLLTYQKVFQFTHNDLHTNNIMYVETEKQFIYYNYNNIYYKVPTFNKIWKLIDFGRSIYTVNNIRFASDSFFKSEDAYSQYNTEPFYEENKTRIEPNYSFDLCRLGCSLYDYFIHEDDDNNKLDDLQSLISDWCHDDNNKNILYKKNGQERYPEFKLYKMIARLVHNHTPEKQLDNDIFKSYIITKKKISKKINIIKINNIKIQDSQ